ncbi:dihydropteroate synthase [Chryseobacterium sp. 6424]|nr:dihydropteroate synthase [Chryseobacterium sp. 6424]
MGILNLTPDSFSDGGRFMNVKDALQHAERMIEEGADIIDIGAQSTRPGAKKLSAADEIERLGNIIAEIKAHFPQVLVSLDTFYADVVKLGFDQGLDLINDISGGMFDDKMIETAAETRLPYILMHVNPTYQTMHVADIDADIILTINQYFSEKVQQLRAAGVKDIILDPGFGFGKTVQQQFQMTEELGFIGFGALPMLVGISRKSFIYKSMGKSPLEISKETQALHMKMLLQNAKILRVHDVAETRQTISRFLKN